MTAVRVFDPPMCCSTGICGPSVDPQLARFAADLDWLKTQGVEVERFNLSQQPGAFADDAAAKTALETKGEAGLPLVKVNGEVKSSGTYPSRVELAAWAGVNAPLPSTATTAPGSEPAERHPSQQALAEAAVPASPETASAETSVGCCGPSAKTEEPTPKAAGCCGPASKGESSPKKSGCC